MKTRILAAAGNYNESSTNAAATVTKDAPGDGKQISWCGHVFFGYDADPAATGFLTITVDAVTVLKIPVSKGGAGFIPYPEVATGGNNKAVVASLSAGGSGVKAWVGFSQCWTESCPHSM